MNEDSEDTVVILVLLPLIIAGILIVMFLPPIVYEITWSVGLGLSFWGMLFLIFRKRDKKDTTGAKNRGWKGAKGRHHGGNKSGKPKHTG